MTSETPKTVSLLRKRIARLVEKAVHRHLGESDDRLEDVAGDLGVSPSYLSNIMHCHNNAGCPVDALVRLTRCLGDFTMIQGVADACGGVFLALPDAEAHARPEAIAAARLATEKAAAAVSALLGAIEDGRVTRAEVAGLEDAVPEAQSAIGQLLKIAAELARTGRREAADEKF